MSESVFEKSVRIERPAAEVFAWLERPGALERLTPPWENVRVLRTDGSIRDGSQVEIESRVFGLPLRWLVEHRDFVEGEQFRDVLLEGPFDKWEHLHRVDVVRPGQTEHRDRIVFKPAGGFLGSLFAGGLIRRRLERMFAYRHTTIRNDLELSVRYGAVRRMRIVIAGSSGFVGNALVAFLETQGHEVVRLVRRDSTGPDEISWSPESGTLDPHALRAVDVVINLCGESVASGRWTKERRERLWWSRIHATRTLVNAIEAAKHRPFLLINASATGFYGSRGDQRLDEASQRGDGFLADLCEAWENEAMRAEALGIRVVTPRLGVVLSPDGGALKKLLTPFNLGLGGPAGPRRHWLSWISRDDAIGALYHCILDQRCRGPVNLVSPEAVRQSAWARTLGAVLRRPAWLPVPAFVLRLIFGAMADETILANTRVVPERLLQTGYHFRHRTLAAALAHCLGCRPIKIAETTDQGVQGARRGRRRRR